MLTKFRKGADNIFVRILLGFIALSFVGFGALNFLDGNSRGDVITFKNTKSIPTEMFLAMKAKEIDRIGRENNINLTEEQIKDLNLDYQILQKLINDSMVEYLAKIYDFDISENVVINFVKKMPYFQDKDGNFELIAFKSAFRNSQRQEDQYLESLKASLIKTTLLDVFMESFKPSKIMVDNLINYMAETKTFDLVSIDLTNQITDFKNDQISETELKEFYKRNENDFVLSELRSFDYISIGRDYFVKDIKIDENDIKTYYEENKNDFDNKPYNKIKKDITELLYTSKLEELMANLAKKIEEDVASGFSLKDLTVKYNTKITFIGPVDRAMLNNDKNLNLGDFADSIFEMTENEISYPMELQDQHKIMIVELKNITPSRNQEFSEVKDKIFSILTHRATIIANGKILEEFRKNYDPTKVTLSKTNTINIEKNKSITRADMDSEKALNLEIAYLILNCNKNEATNLVRVGNKAYFAYIKDSKITDDKVKKVADKATPQILGAIKEGVLQELIGYLTEQNDVKVNLENKN